MSCFVLSCLAISLFVAQDVRPAAPQQNTTPPQQYHPQLIWKTEPVFQTPESVFYDAARDVLFVSNFRKTDPNTESEFISLVETSGKIRTLKWITGLSRPTGLTIDHDDLYVVERGNLVRIDIEGGKIKQRYPIPGSDFANDIVFDAAGTGYITDNGRDPKTAIFRFRNEKMTPWLTSEQILKPNGLLIEGDDLIAYDNRRQALVRIDLAGGGISEIAKIISDAPAVGDGIIKLAPEVYLVTAWGGPSWIVRSDGTVAPFLDTGTLTEDPEKPVGNADIGFVPDRQIVVIPAFSDNRLWAYKLSKPAAAINH